eukprot:15220816-Alexandrium_andersonii.AAC.1
MGQAASFALAELVWHVQLCVQRAWRQEYYIALDMRVPLWHAAVCVQGVKCENHWLCLTFSMWYGVCLGVEFCGQGFALVCGRSCGSAVARSLVH